MNKGISILIVEDEPAIAELIAFTVKSSGWHAEKVYSGADALTVLTRIQPTVVLLDWMLPDLSGLDVLKKIRSDNHLKKLPVIMLTAKTKVDDKVIGLDNGADDYVTKPFSPKELIARINALLRRQVPEKSNTCFNIGAISLDTRRCQVSIGGDFIKMNPSEYLLLKFLMANPDQVFSRGQLLDSVWHDVLDIEERTIDVHILRLRKALGKHGSIIQTVRGIGYMLSSQ